MTDSPGTAGLSTARAAATAVARQYGLDIAEARAEAAYHYTVAVRKWDGRGTLKGYINWYVRKRTMSAVRRAARRVAVLTRKLMDLESLPDRRRPGADKLLAELGPDAACVGRTALDMDGPPRKRRTQTRTVLAAAWGAGRYARAATELREALA